MTTQLPLNCVPIRSFESFYSQRQTQKGHTPAVMKRIYLCKNGTGKTIRLLFSPERNSPFPGQVTWAMVWYTNCVELLGDLVLIQSSSV